MFTVSDLTDEERHVLSRGLAEWGGPAHCTNALAIAIDVESATALLEEANRLIPVIRDRQPLTRRHWRRALIAAEIVFASDVFGSGWDWATTTGITDEDTIRILRSLQRKIARSVKTHQLWPSALRLDSRKAGQNLILGAGAGGRSRFQRVAEV